MACSDCGKIHLSTYKTSKCKNCLRRYNKDFNLKLDFGISLEQYEDILIDQLGVCAICNKKEPVKNKRLAVDHCHTSGKIRGLLCSNCNLALGHFKDNVQFLANAISYLESNKE